MFAVLVLPLLLGSITSLSDSSAPALEQSVLDTFGGNRTSSGQSFQLSELRDGAAMEQDFELAARVTSTSAFVWPAVGDITSYMDANHPMGIDIGLDYGGDSPIRAAARGVVEFAGGSDGDTYGYYVKVDHGDGLVTLYAHLSEILVSPGQAVDQGEVIGYGGSTGKSSGKHLHFEVRQGDYLANPLDLLPSLPEAPKVVDLDCSFGLLVLDRGSSAELDFSASLPAGSRISTANLRVSGPSDEMPLPVAEKVSDGMVRLDTQPYVEPFGLASEASYGLDLVIETSREHYKTCEINVQTRTSSMTAYSEASILAASNSYEPPPPEAEPVAVEPTAAPTEETVAPQGETPTAVPTEEPLVVPTGVPMLGPLTSPTPSPTPTATETPTATPTETKTPEPTATATATATSTPEPDDDQEDDAESE